MDSLLASYASSSDEEIEEKSSSDLGTNRPSVSLPQPQFLFPNPNTDLSQPTKGSLFSSLPAKKGGNSTKPLGFDPNPNRFSASKPSVERTGDFDGEIEGKTSKGSIFSSIPAPKSKESTNPLGLNLNPKKVVRFTPPINPSLHKDDDEEEEEIEKKKPIFDSSFNTSSSLFSMLPAPKNSLCLAPQSNSSNFASRKSSLNTQLPAKNTPQIEEPTQFEPYQTYNNSVPVQTGYESMASYTEVAPLETSSSGNVENYGSFEGNNNNNESSNYNNNITMIHEMGRAKGKRGRNEMPAEIVEVKQDELMKNRPKQDPRKLTGIAFGPSYQPAPTEKGKVSKLHKRKHQIGTLYHDLKSKEMELAERRSKGFLTKAETQAKYGW